MSKTPSDTEKIACVRMWNSWRRKYPTLPADLPDPIGDLDKLYDCIMGWGGRRA